MKWASIFFFLGAAALFARGLFSLMEREKPIHFFRSVCRPVRSWREAERLRVQWPPALLFLSEALKTGLGIERALEALRTEAPEPLRSRINAGFHGLEWLPLESRMKKLFSDPALTLARASLLLSHETGGKAAGLLEKAAEILKNKSEMEEKMKTLTAQGKASAWIIGLSPFGLLASFFFLSPDYIDPLLHTRAGALVLVSAAMMVLVGLFFIHRAARLEP